MKRQLVELSDLACLYSCPIICAGDVFDRWNPPPELINFALAYLPHMWAIPGQHDLPHHRIEDIRKSAYWTLVEAKKISNIQPKEGVHGLVLHPFPWGSKIKPLKKPTHSLCLDVAVIHSYVWNADMGFPGAPKERRIGRFAKKISGYDIAHFGDNHNFFTVKRNGVVCFNPGSFFQRTQDDNQKEGRYGVVGKIMADGSVRPHWLESVSHDKFIDPKEETKTWDVSKFIEGLGDLVKHELNYVEAVKQQCLVQKINKHVAEMIDQALQSKGK